LKDWAFASAPARPRFVAADFPLNGFPLDDFSVDGFEFLVGPVLACTAFSLAPDLVGGTLPDADGFAVDFVSGFDTDFASPSIVTGLRLGALRSALEDGFEPGLLSSWFAMGT
ncbi:MAG: hypothetical protein AAF737_04345, partial [Pseudomonadota bacterium]